MFKVIIAGGRDFDDLSLVVAFCDQILKNKKSVEIVSGTARGADRLGEVYAYSKGYSVKRFAANWEKHGKAAGPIRNAEMADYTDAAIIFWDQKSKGTANMIEQMQKRNKPYRVINYEKSSI